MNWKELVAPGPVTPEAEEFLKAVAAEPDVYQRMVESQRVTGLTYMGEMFAGLGDDDVPRTEAELQAKLDPVTDKLGLPRVRAHLYPNEEGYSYTLLGDLYFRAEVDDATLAHELAHYVTGHRLLAEGASPADAFWAGHGPDFRATYLDLLGEMDLYLEAWRLRHVWEVTGVEVGTSMLDRRTERVAA